MSKYVNRLFTEWKQHGKIIISVDYDDTVFNYSLNNHIRQEKVISSLKEAKKIGCYIVIFTASANSRHDEIRKHCKSIGLEIDCINTNPIPLPYGNEGKIYYNINLCDRSGLKESLKILNKTMKKYKKWKIS